MEFWKDIIGYEGHYQISNLGRVKSLEREIARGGRDHLIKERFLKTAINPSGYYIIVLALDNNHKTMTIHRLLARHFIQNPNNKRCVNHINGIKTDNSLENLEWCTHSENTKHAFSTNLKKPSMGEENGSSKLTNKQVLEIKNLLKNNIKGIDIAKMFSVSTSTISYIKLKKYWGHIYQ